ncbi:hypothetical protein D3C72_1913290 [compost metagenome]
MFAVQAGEVGDGGSVQFRQLAAAEGLQLVVDGAPARVQVAVLGQQLLDLGGGVRLPRHDQREQLLLLVLMVRRAGDLEIAHDAGDGVQHGVAVAVAGDVAGQRVQLLAKMAHLVVTGIQHVQRFVEGRRGDRAGEGVQAQHGMLQKTVGWFQYGAWRRRCP